MIGNLMNSPAIKSVYKLAEISHLPPSFDNNPLLYAAALMSVMSITAMSLGMVGWMVRDTWRDRKVFHPKTLLFKFRQMIAIISTVAFIRCLPEMLYLQMYGDPDVSAEAQAYITTAKRMADASALWFVVAWMAIFVAIYPPICVALRSHPAKAVEIDVTATWPRLLPPAIVTLCIIGVSATFAIAKVAN